MQHRTFWLVLAWATLALGQLMLFQRLSALSPAPATPVSEPAAATSLTPPGTGPNVSSTDVPAAVDASQDSDRATLRRIEQRLLQIEQRLAQPRVNTSAPGPAETVIDMRAADQKLASLLPSGPVSQRELAQFHRDLQQAPPEQRVALATALARAVNDGRIQPTPP